jgi:DNA modification methylase
VSDFNYQLLIGDCVQSMQALADGSVNTCVTSPPYFGLRDYGHEGQLGLEETPGEYVAALVRVFREVRRVLRDDGTLWLNLGDSYAGSWGAQSRPNGGDASSTIDGGSMLSARQIAAHPKRTNTGSLKNTPGLKPKDLIGIPWRVAFALQADGWYLRQDIIWHKPNPMPESVRDRCTKSHEYVFLLSKSPQYYYDHEAVKEPAVCGARGSEFHTGKTGKHQLGRAQKIRPSAAKGSFNSKGEPLPGQLPFRAVTDMRNRRSVWTVSTRPYKGAHFATFPPDLIGPCILAGCPEGGTVLDTFGGSGTTAGVALANHRNAILCELNPDYADLVAERVKSIVQSQKDTRQIDIFAGDAA